MKDVNALNRKTCIHTYVKMSSLLIFQHFYLIQCISNLQRGDSNASGNILIAAILFLFFGALDWGLTAREIESLPHCPHFTQAYSILRPPFLTLYTL